MAAKPVHLRELASVDLESAAEHYLSQADAAVATRFIGAFQRATRRISRNPQLGTLRLASELEIPGLRSMPVDRFPYLVFCVERDGRVDVWRVLHGRRDIPSALLGDPEG